MTTPQPDWRKEYKHLISLDELDDVWVDQYQEQLQCTPQKTLLRTYNDNHDFYQYPENMYELDPDKIEKFIEKVEADAYERGYGQGFADGQPKSGAVNQYLNS